MTRSELDRECARTPKVTISAVYGSDEPIPDGFPAGTSPWTVTLRFQRRQLTTCYFTGPAITDDPTAADVLSCLLMDAHAADEYQDVDEFSDAFGYTKPSAAIRAWNACGEMKTKLERLLGSSWDRFSGCEH